MHTLRPDLRLRPLDPGDHGRVLRVLDDWWGRPMGALLPRPFFTHFRETSFVLERRDELVGFLVGFLSQTHADEAYIHAVGIAPDDRGKGLGRMLYQRFFAVVAAHGRRRVRAVTSPVNTGSVEFHRRLGFAVTEPARDGSVSFLRELEVDISDVRSACAALHVPLTGALVALEPLAAKHEADLWQAAQDGQVWTWMPMEAGRSRAAFREWFVHMAARTEIEPAAPFAVVARETGRAV